MPRRTVRTSISLPPELRKEMDECKGVNWSFVARKAIRAAIRAAKGRGKADAKVV